MLKSLERKGKRMLARALAIFLGVESAGPEVLDQITVEKALVIRQQNQMGDMLLAVPALRGIRRRFPDAAISMIAATINSDVLRNNPYIDELLIYDKKKYLRNPAALISLLLGIRRMKFDLVIVLNTVSFSVTSMLLAVLSGAAVRAGVESAPFGNALSERFYHIELPLPPADEIERMHESEHNLYPLAVLGVREKDLSSLLVPAGEEEAEAEFFISSEVGGDFILVHPGAGKAANIWPACRFAAAADGLAEKYGLRVVAVRGPADRESFNAFIEASASSPARLISPSVGMLGAVMKRASVTLCNDTGIMHIAGAVKAGSVAVFGPTDPNRWKPAVDSVIAVRAGDHLIESVTVEEVTAAAERFLS